MAENEQRCTLRVVTCPTCGGQDREPIAPGYWRCTTVRTVTEANPGASGFGAPHHVRASIPPTVERRITCNERYYEGAPASDAALCHCRTYAIGFCTECGDPVCGLHSDLWEGRRVCSDDAERLEQTRERARVAERDRRQEREGQAERGRLLEFVRSIENPDDRFVAAACLRAPTSIRQPAKRDLAELFVGTSFRFFTSAKGLEWQWSSAEVMAWAADRGKSRSSKVAVQEMRKPWYSSVTRAKTVGVFDGWMIGERGYTASRWGDLVSGSWPLYAVTNGMVIEVRETDPLRGLVSYEGSRTLRAADLFSLADAVGLRVPVVRAKHS